MHDDPRIYFTRNAAGAILFPEGRMARINAALRQMAGPQEARIPHEIMSAACRELVSACNRLVDAHGMAFHEAARRVVAERPNLFLFTRNVCVHDGDSTANVLLDDDEGDDE